MTEARTGPTMCAMRATLAVAAAVLAGCPGEDPPPLSLDGEWSLTWTCDFGCEHEQPTLADAATATIDADVVTWTRTRYGEIERTGTRVDECLSIEGDSEQTNFRSRDPFDVCLVGETIEAAFWEHAQAGELQVSWHVVGVR